MKKVLVTGMAGMIGSAFGRHMADKYELSALDVREVQGVPSRVADIGDLDAIQPAFEGIDAVVHLAYILPDDEATLDDLWRVNIGGTYNVYEAARRAGVKHIVNASSGTVVMNHLWEEPYKAIIESRYEDVPETWPLLTTDIPYRPNMLYACCKVWNETIARYYADLHGISSVCVRFGRVWPEDRPMTSERMSKGASMSLWTSQRDAARGLACGIDNPPAEKYAAVNIVSHSSWGIMDLSYSKDAIGFEPLDSADDYA